MTILFRAALLLGACLALPWDTLDTARRQLASGDAAAAQKTLREALAKGTEDERAVRLLLAEALLATSDAQEAVELLQPLVEAEDHEGTLAAGKAYKAWGDLLIGSPRRRDDAGFAYDEAHAHFERAAALAPAGDTGASVEAGFLELYQRGDHEAALARAEALLGEHAGDGQALLLRGCAGVYASIAAAEESEEEGAVVRGQAIDDLVAAAKALPKERVEPWAQLAWLYGQDGQPRKAVEAALAVYDRRPDTGFASLFDMAKRYAAARQFDAAGLAVVEMAKRDAGQLTEWLAAEQLVTQVAQDLAWSLGPQLAALGSPASAARAAPVRAALAAICAAEPRSADVWNNYALLSRDLGDFEESYRAYEKSVELSPDDPRLLNDTALVLHYYLHRDYERAAELYERAVEAADEKLAAAGLSEAERADLELARTDATNNMQKLARGEYEWGR